jgi:hypothetical protein
MYRSFEGEGKKCDWGSVQLPSIMETSPWRRDAVVAMELEAVSRCVPESGSDRAFVVNHSGGKDSHECLDLSATNAGIARLTLVMEDTGFKHQRPTSAADFAASVVRNLGPSDGGTKS